MEFESVGNGLHSFYDIEQIEDDELAGYQYHFGNDDAEYSWENFCSCVPQVTYSVIESLYYVALYTLIVKIADALRLTSISRANIVLICGVLLLLSKYTDLPSDPFYTSFGLFVLLETVVLSQWLSTNTSLFLCIFFIPTIWATTEAQSFVASRGIFMLLTMRLCSVVVDRQRNEESEKEYLYHPSFLFYGPYMTMEQFSQQTYNGLKVELGRLTKAGLWFTIAIFFLSISACSDLSFIHLPLINEYLTALSFRSSHYFVCFLSQALAALNGVDLIVTNPWEIEIPRSITQVVVSWNYPMHTFLHKYIYSPLRNSQRQGLGLFFTFFVSSILHGLDLQFAAVLLTLASISFVENEVRARLARRFNACVKSRPCKPRCSHLYKQFSLRTIFINSSFSVLAIYHLIYTGMVFTDDGAEHGYGVLHTIDIWKGHYFSSHIIVIISSLYLLFF